MTDRNRLSTYAPAAIAAALVAMHFMGFGPEKVESGKPAPVAKKAHRPPRHDLDEAKWEEWRERHRAAISDVGEDRTSKEFQLRMRTLGTTPIEIPTGDDDDGGLFVAKSASDLEGFLAEGGHYSGPLPPHLRGAAAPGTEDGR